jgi:hypothetical protein
MTTKLAAPPKLVAPRKTTPVKQRRLIKGLVPSAVIKRVGDHFLSVIQWDAYRNAECAHYRATYLLKAEALLEMLESLDCGSIGGYDKGQPRTHSIFERWDWLYRKHVGNPETTQCTGRNEPKAYDVIKAFFANK